MCAAHCGIKVTIQDNKFVKIIPDFDDPVSQGYICEKAQKLIGFQHSPDRITRPMKKTDKGFVCISWEQALDEIAVRLKKIDRSKIFYMASAMPDHRGEYTYELVRRLGAKYVSNVFSMEKIYPSMVNSMFFGSLPHADIKNSQAHIVIGQNPWITQHYPRARKILNDLSNDPNRYLIVIDPCQTDTSDMADVYVKPAPGTDAWLLSALIKIMIENDYINYEYISQQTKNYDKIKTYFSNVDIEECLNICRVPVEQLHNLAKIINSSTSVSVNSGNGTCHSLNPFAVNYLIILLYTLTGNYQKVGGMNIISDPIDPGMISNHYFTETHVPFGNQKQFGGVTSSSLIGDNLYINENQKFHCVIIDNNNPIGRFPNSDKFKSQLENVDIVIALDSFQTQSTDAADYILPVKTFFESYEVSTISNKIAQLSEPIIDLNSTKTVIEIYELILEKLSLIDNKELDEFKLLFDKNQVAFYDCLFERYNNKIPDVYYTLNKVIGNRYKNLVIPIMWWKFFLLSKKKYTTAQSIVLSDKLADELNSTGKVITNFQSEKTNSIIDLTPGYFLSTLKLNKFQLSDPNYKFILQCGYRKRDAVNNIIPNINQPILEISSHDMLQLSLSNNDLVILETDSAEIVIKCREDKNLQAGLIRIANHAIINRLTNNKNRDYLNPQYKLVFANIRKTQ